MLLTKEQLKGIMPLITQKNLDLFISPLNVTLEKYQINTPKRIGCFLSQAGHETASFRYMRELATGAAYDVGQLAVNLGNTPEDDGDGERYKGRGIFQTTGLANYKRVSKVMGIDFVKNPELLELPENACTAAGIYWTDRKLALWADKLDMSKELGLKIKDEYTPFEEMSRRINGGFKGYEDRLDYLRRASKVLKF